MKKLNYIGLDVHKKNIVMGESRKSGEAQITGEFLNTGVRTATPTPEKI